MKYRPKHIAEYLLLRAFAASVRFMPYRLGLIVAWGHAWLIFFVFRFRAAEAQRRIQEVYGDRYSPAEARRIAWISMRNTCFNVVEVIRANSGSKLWLPPHIDYSDAFAKIQKHADTGKGAVLAAAHMGNWELAGLLAPSLGIPLFTIFAAQKNPLVNDFIQKLRSGPGVELIERGGGTMRAVLRKLKAGKMLALLPDVRSRQPGVSVNFMGGQANIFPGTALFALQTKVPVYLCLLRREGWTHHHVSMLGPYTPNTEIPKGEAIEATMQRLLGDINAAIEDDPAQWFWFNKRWILDPLPPLETETP
jgi:KDO2-lipid IV(A) lauroyltransferase